MFQKQESERKKNIEASRGVEEEGRLPLRREKLQQATFRYFVEEANPVTGLIADTTRQVSPSIKQYTAQADLVPRFRSPVGGHAGQNPGAALLVHQAARAVKSSSR